MIIVILSLIFLGIGAIGFIASIYNVFSDTATIVCFTLFSVGVINVLCLAIDRDRNPTAMDVYRGKATIAITYADGVPVDSTVVFKKKK